MDVGRLLAEVQGARSERIGDEGAPCTVFLDGVHDRDVAYARIYRAF
jgi:hypothetical protein